MFDLTKLIRFEEVNCRYVCRLKICPNSLMWTFDHINPKIYQFVHGPKEFIVTGNCKEWNRWDDLSKN